MADILDGPDFKVNSQACKPGRFVSSQAAELRKVSCHREPDIIWRGKSLALANLNLF